MPLLNDRERFCRALSIPDVFELAADCAMIASRDARMKALFSDGVEALVPGIMTGWGQRVGPGEKAPKIVRGGLKNLDSWISGNSA